MPSFSDSVFLFLLALLLFGPKRLPVLARELGKWIGEFRRASNEFKLQMDEELRASEQADRQKQIAAMEAAAPVQAVPEPEHPHLRDAAGEHVSAGDLSQPVATEPITPASEPLPIASSGSLNLMPPSTGLPTPRSRSSQAASDTLDGFIESIPVMNESTDSHGSHNEAVEETAAHG